MVLTPSEVERYRRELNYQPTPPRTAKQPRIGRVSKLTDEQVVAIRGFADLGILQVTIARTFNVSPSYIFQIVHRRTRTNAEQLEARRLGIEGGPSERELFVRHQATCTGCDRGVGRPPWNKLIKTLGTQK